MRRPAADGLDPAASRRRQVALWGVFLLFLPVAFLGLILLPNEYRSWGGGGVDCDGPSLLLFAVPAAIVYALLGLIFTGRMLMLRSWVSGVALVFCGLLVAGLWNNIRKARAELEDPGYRQVCDRR